jgi:hypothetical protein
MSEALEVNPALHAREHIRYDVAHLEIFISTKWSRNATWRPYRRHCSATQHDGVGFIRELFHELTGVEMHVLNAANAARAQPADDDAPVDCGSTIVSDLVAKMFCFVWGVRGDLQDSLEREEILRQDEE